MGVIDDLFAQASSPAPQQDTTSQLALIQALMQNKGGGGNGSPGGDHSHGANGAHGPGKAGPPSNAAHQLIHFAHRQLGKPYIWGSTGMNGFDCSGLIYADLRHMGYNIPGNVRTAASFQHWTPNVSRKGLQPGDLVYMWYPNSRGIPHGTASHVGLYAGRGKMIDAGSGGVQKEGVDWSAFIGGGRIPHI